VAMIITERSVVIDIITDGFLILENGKTIIEESRGLVR